MLKKDVRIVFMGTPSISAYVLEALLENGFNVVGVIAQPDKPVGRNSETISVPTKKVAMKYSIPVFQPIKIRKEYAFLDAIKPDLILTLAYGQIVPQGLLDIPKYGCLNLHGSILPKYRGASPIQTALINNEKETGITLMEMTDRMDAGRIYAIEKVQIAEDDNSTSLFLKMGEAAKKLALSAIPDYIDGKLPGVQQDELKATYCSTIKPEQEKLDPSLNCENFLGWIRALADKPGAYVILDNIKIKIFKGKIINNVPSKDVGKIVQADKNGFVIQLHDGQLSILELQKEGKKRMDYKSFVNGTKDLIGKYIS